MHDRLFHALGGFRAGRAIMAAFALTSVASGFAAEAAAQNTPRNHAEAAPFHYFSFNTLKADKTSARAQFDAYIEALGPIMARHGGKTAFTEFLSSSDAFKTDVITFGSFPSMTAMSGFFQDSEFQAAFPMLLEALADHWTLAVAGPPPDSLAPRHAHEAVLTIFWLDDPQAEIRPRDDPRRLAYWRPLASTFGLGSDARNETPPNFMALSAGALDLHALEFDGEIARRLEIRLAFPD
ncbi:MAG: hypothetical protein Tsb0010_12360 [Parvularculaceae bacterium]